MDIDAVSRRLNNDNGAARIEFCRARVELQMSL